MADQENQEVCIDMQVKFYESNLVDAVNSMCQCGSTDFQFGNEDQDSDEDATEFDHTLVCQGCGIVHKVRVRVNKIAPKSECKH